MNITPIQISRQLSKKNNSVTPSSIMKNKILQQQKQQQQLQNTGRERSQSLPGNIFSKLKEKHYLPAAVFGFDESDISETESDNSDYDDDDENEDDDENSKNENEADLINLEQELVSL